MSGARGPWPCFHRHSGASPQRSRHRLRCSLAWVVGFTMGPFGAIERPYKPFNSVLGETFEYTTPAGARYLAEQVSHHPPIGAGHGEGELWAYDLVSAPKTKFLGNSVEVYPIGRTRIRLKPTGEVFSLVPPTSKAHNVILGSTWIDTYGDYTLVNTTTGTGGERKRGARM